MHADFLGLYMLGIVYKHDGSEKEREREERGRGVFFHEKRAPVHCPSERVLKVPSTCTGLKLATLVVCVWRIEKSRCSECLFVWILIVFTLFVWFVCFCVVFTGVLHSNIYIGRDFFCALILSNYGNTSWQNRKQNDRGKKENTELVVMKGDALDKSEILS